jgi:UDP-2,3-diacylglucosamine pyrophosphatase LpxH
MKLSVISDTHFGDSGCSLVSQNQGKWEINDEYYGKFLDCLRDSSGEIRDFGYLLMLGDVFDLAVSNYDNTYKAARPFFERLKADNIFKEVIITIGNHDHALWTNLQHQISISERIDAKLEPQSLDWSVPVLLDNRNKQLALTGDGYCNTFIDRLTVPNTKFRVASPNVYLIDSHQSILFTHGQFFDAPWSIFGELAKVMFKDDLNKIQLTPMQHILGDNFTVDQLICGGLGQGEVNFTNIVQSLEHDIKKGNYQTMIKYIWNILKEEGLEKDLMISFLVVVNYYFLSKIFKHRKPISPDAFEEIIMSQIDSLDEEGEDVSAHRERLRDNLANMKKLMNPSAEKSNDRIADFYNASLEEVNVLVDNISSLDYIIYGHTHSPVPWSGKKIVWDQFNRDTAPNTGAWLHKGDAGFCGANVFIYDSETEDITYRGIPPA